MISRCMAYSPSHITGFFTTENSDDSRKKGSRGAGIVLEAGCLTTVEKAVSKNRRSLSKKIFINGREETARTTEAVLSKILEDEGVTVSSSFDVPLMGGFGASASGAMSTAIAINHLYKKNLTFKEISEVVHVAEVEKKTGLGDADAITIGGGLVVRKKGGSIKYGSFDIVPVEPTKVGYVFFGEVSTREILGNDKMMKRINEAGLKKLKSLLRRPTLENFMNLSYEFSCETGLATGRMMDAIEEVRNNGGLASMAMLGETVFAIGNYTSLKDFGELKETEITFEHAHIM